MTRDIRNQRALALAHRLDQVIAANIAAGVRQLQEERRQALEGPARGESSGRGGSTTSTTERNANEAYRLGLQLEDLRDQLAEAEKVVRKLGRLALQAVRTRAFGKPAVDEPTDEAVCRDGQVGKEGAIVWGDVTCERLPMKAKMCVKHYTLWYRYRVAHGVDTSRDFEKGAA